MLGWHQFYPTTMTIIVNDIMFEAVKNKYRQERCLRCGFSYIRDYELKRFIRAGRGKRGF